MDNDRLSDPDLIGTYTYSFLPSALSSWEHIYPNNRKNAHSSTNLSAVRVKQPVLSLHSPFYFRMYVKIRRTCKPHHFGPSCIPCHIPKARGTCDFNGFPICNAGRLLCTTSSLGYSGPECSQHNFCRDSSPCAPFAVCVNTEDSFICLCDGTSGKRCEVGFDPCSEHICLHNGTCIAVGENRNFAECINCDVGWSGLHCEEKADACAEEERRLGRPPCANGGHCVSRMNGTVLTCLCEDGWQGPRCEMAFTTVGHCGIVRRLLLSQIKSAFHSIPFRYQLFLWPSQFASSITKPRGVEMQPVKVDLNGDLCKANNLYEEMGNKSATGGKKLLESLDYDLPSSKSVNDADYEDYEAMAIQQYDPIHKAFTPVPASESFDNEEYEPVSMRAHDGGLVTQTPEPGSAYLNNEEYETVSETTDYRPLPAPPMGSNAKAFL
ncbi:unnamed protein product [Hydatigera taeniaeformis]|uniref:EGF-like domain-containing protein n=1 Tax=Hydatigena taeniaeformis TaxID=6205 RepID=A0A0R3XAA5_HYDTA|nr:unnamed protein product [Hydatigera taeniaeformis]